MCGAIFHGVGPRLVHRFVWFLVPVFFQSLITAMPWVVTAILMYRGPCVLMAPLWYLYFLVINAGCGRKDLGPNP